MALDLRRLRYFVAVAEERNFRRAAAQLHVAQPSLSQQIARLERELGVVLFDRSVQPVALTPAAAELLPRARRLLSDVEVAAEATRRAGGAPDCQLTVGFVGSAGRAELPGVIQALRQAHPGMEIRLRDLPLGSAAEAVQTGEVDVSMSRGVERGDGVVSIELKPDSLVVAVPVGHRLERRNEVGLGSLTEEIFVRPASSDDLRPWSDFITDLCGQSGFEPRWSLEEGSSHQAIVGLVASGVGIALLSCTSHALPRKGVAALPLSGASMPLVVVHRAGDASPLVAAFVQALEPTSPSRSAGNRGVPLAGSRDTTSHRQRNDTRAVAPGQADGSRVA
jgi:DNA-binding transcriptional LysR family regulator